MKNSRTRMVAACSIMIILFLEVFAASFIFAFLGLIYINRLLRLFWKSTCFAFRRGFYNRIQRFALRTLKTEHRKFKSRSLRRESHKNNKKNGRKVHPTYPKKLFYHDLNKRSPADTSNKNPLMMHW